jgi:hypothetical protein
MPGGPDSRSRSSGTAIALAAAITACSIHQGYASWMVVSTGKALTRITVGTSRLVR